MSPDLYDDSKFRPDDRNIGQYLCFIYQVSSLHKFPRLIYILVFSLVKGAENSNVLLPTYWITTTYLVDSIEYGIFYVGK